MAIISVFCADLAGIAQLVEQLICNQQVGGSSPSTGSRQALEQELNMGDFPSGQRGQTVNLLAMPSVVRIHHPPPTETTIVIRTPVCWTTMVVFVFALQIAAFSSRTTHYLVGHRFSNSGKSVQKFRIMCDSNTLVQITHLENPLSL